MGPQKKSPEPVMLASGASGRVNALLSLRSLRRVLHLVCAVVLTLLLPFRRQRRPAERSSSSAGEERRVDVSRKGGLVVRVPAATVPWRQPEQEAAARRAAAVRGVMAAREEGRGFELFVTTRGETLFTQSWTHINVMTRGLLVLLHGLNEHSGRYDHFAKKLNNCGFKVYGMDWIGHGGSDGLHGFVQSLDYAVSDLKAFLEKVLAENPGLPCFCFGHSTGAAIILKAVLDPKVDARIQGVVLTSPAVRVQPSHSVVTVLAPIFSLVIPRYQFTAANNGPPVSRDPEALRSKYSDPLVFTGSIRIRTGYEILCLSIYLQKNLSRVNIPFIVLHGKVDTVTDPEGSLRLYREASSADKSIKLYEGLLHDLLIEPERDEIIRDIIHWLSSRA